MEKNSKESLSEVSEKLVSSVKDLMTHAKTEEDLRIGLEKLLGPLLQSIGVESHPKYERHGLDNKTVFKGRPDAVHGQIIIEYEAPNAFSSKKAVSHAFDQLTNYMAAEAGGSKSLAEYIFSRFVGVGFDGHSIFFVQFSKGKNIKIQEKPGKRLFDLRGPYHFDPNSARTFVTYLRALSRLPLTAEHLADRFGPKSNMALKAVSAFADALEYWGSERVRVFFNWYKIYLIIHSLGLRSFRNEWPMILSLR